MDCHECRCHICALPFPACLIGYDLVGAFAYLATLVPQDLADIIDRRLAPYRMAGGLLTLLLTAALLPLQAGTIGDGWSDAFNARMVRNVAVQTSVGIAWQVQFASAFVLSLALFVPRQRLRRRAVANASGLVMIATPLSGHAAMHAAVFGMLHRLNDAIHLLSGGRLEAGDTAHLLGGKIVGGRADFCVGRYG